MASIWPNMPNNDANEPAIQRELCKTSQNLPRMLDSPAASSKASRGAPSAFFAKGSPTDCRAGADREAATLVVEVVVGLALTLTVGAARGATFVAARRGGLVGATLIAGFGFAVVVAAGRGGVPGPAVACAWGTMRLRTAAIACRLSVKTLVSP